VIALAIAVVLPCLGSGFFSDDHAMLGALRLHLDVLPPWWDLYRFTPNDQSQVPPLIGQGLFPWWTSTTLHLHLVRPLASALLALDYALFGASPLPYHLHSLLWFAALLFAVRALFRRLLPPETATIALFLYAVNDAVGAPAVWISARHGLVAAAPAVLGLVAHVRARTEGWRPGRWLAPLGLALGLLGSETALGVVAFVIAFDLFGPVAGSLADRIARAAPIAALAMAYLGLYALAGGGVRGSGGYLDPFGAPLAFVVAAGARVPALLGDALLGLPAELLTAGFVGPAVAGGLIAIAIVGLLWRGVAPLASPEERAAVRWTLAGAVAALLTTVGAFSGGRLLLVPNLGFAILLATILRRGFAAGRAALARRIGAGLLAFLHVVFVPLALFGNEHNLVAMARGTEVAAHDGAREAAGAKNVFIAAGSDPMTTVYAHFVLIGEGAPDAMACWSWLDGAKADTRITRVAPDVLAVEPVGTTFLRGSFEGVYRSPDLAMHDGEEVKQCGTTIRVAAMTDGHPSRIEVAFGAPLESTPDVAVLAWQAGALRRLPLPAVGESVVVPWNPGPAQFF
jgi:hypothetical protein